MLPSTPPRSAGERDVSTETTVATAVDVTGWMQEVASAVEAEAARLTQLDSAIGDGDHGVNMTRGFKAVLAEIDTLAAKSLPDALKEIGTQLVMKVGGASGPLYGTLFMTLGKELNEGPSPGDAARALGA